MNKKLVIFDLDGTLLDTSFDLMNSMNGMLESFGYPLINIEQAKEYIGNGARNFVLRSLPQGKKEVVDEALQVYNRIYNASGSPCTKLYDGIEDILTYLKKQNVLIAILSNKPQPSTDEVYDKYLKEYNFDYVYGNRPGFGHKPDKECGEFLIEKLGVDAKDVIVVGDGETDVIFSKNLGVKCIAVTWGYRSKTILQDAGANVFADDVESLKLLLKEFVANN